MFDKLRQSLENLVNGATTPEARSAALSRMKETLVQARLGIEDLRSGVSQTRVRLAEERRELETVRRRKRLAEGIGDAETVAVAERFERHHAERVDVLERKLGAQEGEVAIAEREVEEMAGELRAALGRGGPAAPAAGVAAAGGTRGTGAPAAGTVDGVDDSGVREELDALARARRRAERDAAAEERLAALKRRMGK
ncbi:MAG: hypothetical protein ACJ79S_04735 [Gemmatimonadaceae bacterium]